MAAEAPDPTTLWKSTEGASAWQTSERVRTQYERPPTELMLDLARLGTGSRVLDLGAGTGEQTILAARRVGPTGSVVAIDISTQMLEVAAQAAQQAGFNNIETREMDAQHLDFEPHSFDAAISRNTLQFVVPNLVQTLKGIHLVLKPKSSLATWVWGERNPFFTIPQAIIRRRLAEPHPLSGIGGQFALADPSLLDGALREAGFNEVNVRVLASSRRYSSLGEAVGTLQQIMGPGSPYGRRLAQLSETDRESTWAEIEQGFRVFESEDGIDIPGEIVLATGSS
jgi:SAM-dependent methyltransferase